MNDIEGRFRKILKPYAAETGVTSAGPFGTRSGYACHRRLLRSSSAAIDPRPFRHQSLSIAPKRNVVAVDLTVSSEYAEKKSRIFRCV
jgi:hypothetical protein